MTHSNTEQTNSIHHKDHYDVLIIGAGAAGMMCAIEAGKRGRRVLILEKADKIGKKILISGGGRCNFTNMFTDADNFISHNPHFCKSALSRYTPWDFVALFESHDLTWTEKTLGQLFCDQKSKAVVQLLVDECNMAGVHFELNEEIVSIQYDSESDNQKDHQHNKQYTVSTPQKDYSCESLVIATGGPSIPKMGATDFALSIAKQFSLKAIPFTAALVPFIFTVDILDEFIKELSGISTFVELSVVKNCNNDSSEKPSKGGGVAFKESILFTHRGISGPAALQISSYWQLGDEICINLFPELDLHTWLEEQKIEHPNAELKTVLAYKLPKRFVSKICQEVINANFEKKTLIQFNHKEIDELIHQLSHWHVLPSGTEGMRTAEVALGGVDTDELSSKTMECKKQSGLYFIGEAMDVTGHLGGHNFQWAWASGWCAGQHV